VWLPGVRTAARPDPGRVRPCSGSACSRPAICRTARDRRTCRPIVIAFLLAGNRRAHSRLRGSLLGAGRGATGASTNGLWARSELHQALAWCLVPGAWCLSPIRPTGWWSNPGRESTRLQQARGQRDGAMQQ
jgi:hypothetical protein